MTDRLDATDGMLLADLRAVHEQLDPMPGGMVDRMKLALTVQRLHAEVAELVRTPMLATRAEPTVADAITFAATDLSLMVNRSREEDRLVLDGWVTSPGATVELHGGDEVRTLVADDDGRFTFADVVPGRAWFVVRPLADSGLGPVVTPAVQL